MKPVRKRNYQAKNVGNFVIKSSRRIAVRVKKLTEKDFSRQWGKKVCGRENVSGLLSISSTRYKNCCEVCQIKFSTRSAIREFAGEPYIFLTIFFCTLHKRDLLVRGCALFNGLDFLSRRKSQVFERRQVARIFSRVARLATLTD